MSAGSPPLPGATCKEFKHSQREPAWTSARKIICGSPAVSNGVVFVSCGIGLTAFDAATGKQLYSSGPIAAGPVLNLAVANGHICFVAADTLYCFGIPMER